MSTRTANIGRSGILQAAENLFTERGYQAVSIRDIAQACGVTNAALYYHFPNKESLFRDVLEQHMARLSEQMRAAGAGLEKPKERLVAMLMEYSSLATSPRAAMFSLRREAKSLKREAMHENHKHLLLTLLAPIEEVFAEAIDAGELRALREGNSPAAILTGMLHASMMHRKACDLETISEDDIAMTVELLWKGMQA